MRSGEYFPSPEVEKPEPIKLKGIDFDIEDIERAWERDRPLQLSISFPREKCNLNCVYCFTDAYREKTQQSVDVAKSVELLEEAKNLGITNLLLAGHGEPFSNKEIWPLLEKARELDLHVTVFTNGALLNATAIEKLREYPVSFVVKVNSFDPEKENRISGVKKYAEKRDEAIRAMIDAGFNKPDKNGFTRMGVSIMVYKDNADDAGEVIDWALERRILPMVSGTALTGKAVKHLDILGNQEDLKAAFRSVEERVHMRSPELHKQLFTPRSGQVVFNTLTVFVEYPSGSVISNVVQRQNIGHVKETLSAIWERNEKEREKQIEMSRDRINALR
ncbi:radical SAM protein [Patescibacteria group bacterium]|nr:MAG: radical SAM protein [Patescibacteria group bacterium]